jgi:hypothetical protein
MVSERENYFAGTIRRHNAYLNQRVQREIERIVE